MAARRNPRPGKQDFIRKILEQDRDAGGGTVNRAWLEGGHEGSISPSAVGKVRGARGLTKPRGSGTRDESPTPVDGKAPPQAPADGTLAVEDRARVFDDLEADLDRVLFRVMAIGEMPEVERLIRQCRRVVILASGPQG